MDLSTLFRYIILLCDDSEKANVLHYSSYKSKRIVRSVLGGEVHAFADAYDATFTIRNDLKRLLKRDSKLTVLTDSMSLFKVVINSSTMTEARLMIDIPAAREAYEANVTDHIG